MWDLLGFKQNIYDHLPISASASGERLLVGRENELDRLMLRIRGRNAIPTLEGDIGVGKTSIIAVSAYKLETQFFQEGGPCYLSLERPFQIEPDESVDRFAERVYQSILIKIHNCRRELIEKNINVGDTARLFNWLTLEQYNSLGGGVGVFTAAVTSNPNTSEGFTSLGFQNKVNLLLKSIFPDSKKGGVICIIDNLELLEKSTKAKAMLEAMRDKVLTGHGLIWVICGARGIVRGVASSPRLQGYLSTPIDVEPLPVEKLGDLINRRVSEYSLNNGQPDTPVGQEGFNHIFRICRDNLRTSLKFCSDFSEWFVDSGNLGSDEKKKYDLLEVWLANEADKILKSIRMTPKPWEVFERIVDFGGSIAPSDHEKFDYDTPMAMRPQIKTLEDSGLVESTIDDSDQRRRTISITPKGWLVNYSRRGYPN